MAAPKKAKKAGPGSKGHKVGGLSDDEKREIERLIHFNSYAEVARRLNREPATIRKYCQRNAITKDSASLRRQADIKARNNHHFRALKDQLDPAEYDFALQTYKNMSEQFGNDVLYTEEIQIVEYCVVTCLLNRALAREMEINNLIREQREIRSDLQQKKDKVNQKKVTTEEEEADKLDLEEYYMDKIEQIDLRIAEFQEEHRSVKKDQKDFFERKDKITKAVNGSRDQRADELSKVNQNFGDFILYLRKNENFRVSVGLEIEKMRLGVKEEYIRLTDPFLYADGEEDFPLFNSEVASRQLDEESSN
jgi:IS30 family transposase